jgi:hypothetical protein
MIKRISRREFTSSVALAAGAVAVSNRVAWAQKAPSSVVEGVQLGVQTYSFRDRPLDEAITAMVEVGVNSCELWQGHLEPQKLDRQALRKWRLETPLSVFREAGQKLKKAGIQLNAYNYSFKKDMTDEEMERGFHMAKMLGTHVITASSNPSIAQKIDGYAKKFKVRVGMHNHAQGGRPDEFDGPKEFAQAMEGASPFICINLDIGHFVAAGFDPVAVDSIGLQIIQAKRREYFGEDKPLNPPAKHILLADTRHHLGTADPEMIELVKLGWKEGAMV